MFCCQVSRLCILLCSTMLAVRAAVDDHHDDIISDQLEPLPQPQHHKQIVYRYIPINKEFFQWDELYDQLYASKERQKQQKLSRTPTKNRAVDGLPTRRTAEKSGSFNNLDKVGQKYNFMSQYKQSSTQNDQSIRNKPPYNSPVESHQHYDYDNSQYNEYDGVTRPNADLNEVTQYHDRGRYEQDHASSDFLEKNIKVFRDQVNNKLVKKPKKHYKKNHFQLNLSVPQFISRQDMRTFLFRLTAFVVLSVIIIVYALNAVASDSQTDWSNILRQYESSRSLATLLDHTDLVTLLEERSKDVMASIQHVFDTEHFDCALVRLCQYGQNSDSRVAKWLISAGLYTTSPDSKSASRPSFQQITTTIFQQQTSDPVQLPCYHMFPGCSK